MRRSQLRVASPPALLALRLDLAQAVFLLAQLGREGFAEILGFEDRADLDLAVARVRVRAPPRPFASSIDRTCHTQKPAINSFVSAKGPSTTVRDAPA
jgi:hypothetical protein